MLTATTSLKNRINKRGQEPSAKFEVDFERSGISIDITDYVQAINIPRTLNSNVPDEVRAVIGYGSASASVTLVGANGKDAAQTWAPTAKLSPFYGKKRVEAPFSASLGYGGEYLKRFTGYIAELNSDAGSRTADMTCIDPSDRLRTKVSLPAMNNVTNPSLDGRYYIDFILEANGIDLSDCDLEDSLNPLTTTPNTDPKQDAWGLLQQIAGAELGCVFFDSTGKFHFWNRNHFGLDQSVDYTASPYTVTVNGVTNPIVTVSLDDVVQGLTFTESVESVKNIINVSYTAYEVLPADWIWQTNDPLHLSSRQTKTVYADLDDPAQQVNTTMSWIGRDFVTANGNSGYRACANRSGTGAPVTNLTFSVTVSAQRVQIDITNPNSYECYLVSPTTIPAADPVGTAGGSYDPAIVGSPMLWLKGHTVTEKTTDSSSTTGSTGSSVSLRSATSITAHGEQGFDFGDEWIQDYSTAYTIANYLLSMLGHPQPILGQVPIVGDCRLELGDRIIVVDPSTGTSTDEECWIVGIEDVYSISDGYKQMLTLRLVAGIGGWILGHPTRSQLGITTVLGGIY